MDQTLTELARAITSLKTDLLLFGFLGFLLGVCFVLALWLFMAKIVKYTDLDIQKKDIINNIR